MLFDGLRRAGQGLFERILYARPLGYPRRMRDDVRVHVLRANDGVLVHALEVSAPTLAPAAPVILFFHGNADTAFDDVPLARLFVERGFRAFALEYRGYGLSRHVAAPSEAGLYADSDALLSHVRALFPAAKLALWGRSLGSGCAMELALRAEPSALVLISPYTSMHDMVRRFAPLPGAQALATARFDNLGKAPQIACPALVVHGDHDRLIPLSMGQRVAASLPAGELLVVPGAHHNDLFARQGDAIVERAGQLFAAVT